MSRHVVCHDYRGIPTIYGMNVCIVHSYVCTCVVILSMIVLNSRGRQGIYGFPCLKNSLTTTFPSNTGHLSIGMKPLAP